MDVCDGIFSMMHTLIQVLTLDSWNGIARPMMKHIGWSWMFFYAYISVAVIVLLNLVTAIIVDNAMANSRKDEEQELAQRQVEKQRHLQEFRTLFDTMDVDGDGQLTWQEFENAFEVPEVATKLKMLDFEPDSCRELFALLDTGDGALSLVEFFDGMSKMDGMAKAKDSFKQLKLTETLHRCLQRHSDDVLEDHEELSRNTPGCVARKRVGTLRHRCQN